MQFSIFKDFAEKFFLPLMIYSLITVALIFNNPLLTYLAIFSISAITFIKNYLSLDPEERKKSSILKYITSVLLLSGLFTMILYIPPLAPYIFILKFIILISAAVMPISKFKKLPKNYYRFFANLVKDIFSWLLALSIWIKSEIGNYRKNKKNNNIAQTNSKVEKVLEKNNYQEDGSIRASDPFAMATEEELKNLGNPSNTNTMHR